MHELQAVGRASEKCVAQKDFGVVAPVVDQGSERRMRELLAEDRRGLNGAPVVGREQIDAGEDGALNGARQLAVDKVAGRPQKLFKKERIAAGAFDAYRGEVLRRRKAARDGFRLGRGERREIDRELKAASRGSPPASVQGIPADTRREGKRCAALRGGASEDRKLAEGLRVGPMHVLDDQQKRLTAGGSLDEPRKRELLAPRAGPVSIAS